MGNCQHKVNRQCLRQVFRKIFKSKFSKLISAIKENNLNVVKHYYAQKLNFNQQLPNGDTPLHIAVKAGHLDIVTFIGENVHPLKTNERNFFGDTPLLSAIMSYHYDGNEKILQREKNKKDSKTQPNQEKEEKLSKKKSSSIKEKYNFPIIEYLVLKKFADVNIPENRGFTPFMAACANGDPDLVKFIIKHKGNYQVKSRDGQTGLHRAAFHGNIDVVRFLIKHIKMNPIIPDNKGNIPLHYACVRLNISCIRVLIKASNIHPSHLLHAENKYGVTPIDILLKVLNRVRVYDDPNDHFRKEDIEYYLWNKRKLPPFKRVGNPGNPGNNNTEPSHDSSVSPHTSRREKSDRKSGPGHRSSRSVALPKNVAIPHLQLNFVSDLSERKILELDSHASVTENDQPKATEEEEFIKIPRTIESTSSGRRAISPLLFRSGILAVEDSSPRLLNKRGGGTPRTMKEGKTDLKINTKTNSFSRERASMRSLSQGRLKTAQQIEEVKSAQDTTLNRGKSRFAAGTSRPDLEENKSFWKRLKFEKIKELVH